MLNHAALLVTEAAFRGGVLLALFHQRRRVGLGPLYLVLGAVQFAQFVLAVPVRLEVMPGFAISPATVVLFPLTVMVVLLTYVDDDAGATSTCSGSLPNRSCSPDASSWRARWPSSPISWARS